MGCCVSSSRTPPSASSPRKHHNPQPASFPSSSSSAKASQNKTPPEEETVKEVLSETPKWKPPTIAKLAPENPPKKPEFLKFPEEGKRIDKVLPIKKEEEIFEEVSEVCSLSESMISTTTTTITDRRDEDDEIRQRVNASPAKMRKNRSFSGDLGGRKERTVGKSPTRRSEQSPGRRNIGSVRLIQTRDQLGQTIVNRGMRNEPHRRLAGENSGRRSRSPATRTDNGAARSIVGRSPSARRTNQSPARVRTAPPESGCRRMEHPSTGGKWPSAATNESLENPLVSLECFIFL